MCVRTLINRVRKIIPRRAQPLWTRILVVYLVNFYTLNKTENNNSVFAVFHRRNMQKVNAAEGEKRKKTGRKDMRRFLNVRIPSISSLPADRPQPLDRPATNGSVRVFGPQLRYLPA